jgi:hypothetical protein
MAKKIPTPKKHVLILGAGASITSGYPDANWLTVLMCDAPTFLNELYKRIKDEEGEEAAKTWTQSTNSPIRSYYNSFRETVALLRSGDFATMDELSNLATGGNRSGEISKLKKLMRFVFALNNPDFSHWPKSDYRALIHKLFERKSQLREDVSIISFNYDPYFEHRLLRAFCARQKVKPLPAEQFNRSIQAITSGFLFPEDTTWSESPGFCHLKLHGTAFLPTPLDRGPLFWPPQQKESTALIAAKIFDFSTLPRFACLSDKQFAAQDPPTLLPWEIISEDGRLLNQEEFESKTDPNWQHKQLYPLFRSIWQRARREIQEADKVSFIGLSLSPFLEPELKYLFAEKKGIIEVVVANPENSKYKDYSYPFHSRTLCGKVLDMFERACPSLCCNRSNNEGRISHYNNPDIVYSSMTPRAASEITARNDFAEFVHFEM